MRFSLGASRARVIRQLVTESLVLAISGGIASIAVAYLLHGVLVGMMSEADSDFPMAFVLDPLMLTFIVATTATTVLLFGVLPAWHAARIDAGASLKEQDRGVSASRRQTRSRRLLVSLQLALSLPLLVGAGLLVRTLYNLQRADLGFPAERLLLVRVDLGEAGYTGPRRDTILQELLTRTRQIPGVRNVTFSQLGLFSGGQSAATIAVERYTSKSDDDRESALDVIGPAHFSTLKVPLRRGREISEQDRDASVTVINESFARRFFVGGDPLGMHISLVNDDGHATFEVIGVANDARTNRLRGEIAPFGASRVIASQLYGVTPHDSLTLVVATALLLLVAFCSSYLPAHRASRVDAMAALRQS